MIKKLLSASLLAAFVFSASAYEVGEFAYTKVAKFKVTGANLVQNGKFTEGATGTDGWTATDPTLPLEATFAMNPGGPNGSNTQKVLAGQTALTNGMYQVVKVDQGGTYIVSLKVMGALPGFTDLDMTGGNVNYINAYWQNDETPVLATVNGTNLYYGTNSTVVNEDGTFGNGISGGYGFSFVETGFTEAVFSINAPANGNIIIDFRGLNEGLEIADVCCHLAEEVYDDRLATDRIAYFQKYLNSEGIETREVYEDFQNSVQEVQAGIAANASPEEMAVLMENLEGIWAEFVNVNFENVLDFVACIDGSDPTGNNSANWMKWTGKYNKLNQNYPTNKAPWTWSTDRWCHKTAAENSPMSIQWMRGAGANSNWNNIATLTYKLRPGTYYWGVTGQGGMMTLNKNRWARSWANECAETKLFFNGDTVLVGVLNAARNQDYVVEFTLAEEKEITLGLICNNVSTNENCGFDVNFYSPVLYKLVVEGELTEEEVAYLEAVQTQLDALKGRLDVAYGYLSEANDTLPWGKAALAEGTAVAQGLYDGWAALTQDDILATMEDEKTLGAVIMDDGVRALNNNYITPFEAMNKPFTDMPGAIAAAESVLGERIYASSSKRADLEASIAASKALYAEKLQVEFSTEDSLALITQRESMAAMVEEFKAAISKTLLVDIDFGTQEAPVQFAEFVDPEGLVDTYYTITGAKGTMKFSDTTGSYCYMLGYNSADSLGMLRVGNSEASVIIEGARAKESDIVNIKFDWYTGNLTKSKAGFKVLSEAGDTICALFYSAYDGNDDINSFGIAYNNLPKVGSSSASNAAIAAASNKIQFDIVLDYGAKTMYCTTISSKGTVTTQAVDLPGYTPAQFIIYSNYGNADRRCWFDNLEIYNIAGEATSGIGSVQVAQPAADGAIYNVMGQRIKKAAKGQLFIQNGVKQIAK